MTRISAFGIISDLGIRISDFGHLLVVMVSLLLSVTGCHKSPTPQPTPTAAASSITQSSSPWLEDATEALGLTFTHAVGPVGTYFMADSLGSGVAIFDFDGTRLP